ncbi:MAG: hypothetical protein G8345_14160 [Magnetococcales bacterium]|nr:hypothetical protein [Magnetococcales bacterium]NGZ28021.1 hypothetical protein [Magnetococcales bacterium]
MKQFKKYLTRFDKELNLRQRSMAVVGVIALLVSFWDQQWMDRYRAYEVEWQKQVQESVKNINGHKVQVAETEDLLSHNPEQELQAKIYLLEQQIRDLNVRTEKENRTLTKPGEMVDILHHFLKGREKIKLVSWENGKPTPLSLPQSVIAAQANQAGEKGPLPTMVFRRDHKLVLKGDYLAILAFLEELEETPWIFYWEKIQFSVIAYPECQTTLEMFTLTMNEEIIGD